MSTTSAEPLQTPAAAGTRHLPLLLANLAMVAGTYAFVAIAGPLARRMHLEPLHIGAVIASVGLVWIVAAPRWGRAADMRGRLPAMRASIVGFVASFLLLAAYVGWALLGDVSAMPPVWASFAALLATRAAMGGCYAGLPVAATAWIADRTAVDGRAAALARFGAAGAVGMVIAPPLAGWLAGYDMTLALAVFALLPLAGLPGLRRLRDDGPRVARQAPPRLKPTDPRLRLPWCSAFALYSVVMIANSALGFYVIDRLQVGVSDASAVVGYTLGSAGIGLIAMQSLVGRLRRVAPRQWLRWGALVGGVGFVSTLAVGPAQPLWMCASYLVAACGMGAAFPAVAALASMRVDAHEQGACAGAMSVAQGLSMVIAPLAGSALYELHPAAPFAAIGVVLAGVFVGTWRRGVPQA
ncbi:MFS transporter [Burkholderia stagnalis]|uniref:MFS transporter n=1 Tax=Burkholderia stagnalis TaxID=1503054 RepID=UPI0007536785|nr:MFS transporter [Burkholderia stagnalis]AOK54349.1 MFS transporter [Burkholderia stagnalis]KVN75228.1 MFS transporter [Burkholderia stagnalis]KWO28592.1 MFS transporter [Burkholderia stagnalis]KWO34238.1 MFS transporter [Burkholderia stagnalis]MDY7807649.1 MFS transporter [Burkholderia stagnalis]